MPRIDIVHDELYPYYYMDTTEFPDSGIEVDDATLMRWRAIEEGFSKMQEEMAELYNKAYA
jgi:hypothetical protein